MYPKNDASPRRLYAKVVKASDGTAITTGVAAYHIQGTTRAAATNTPTHIANGLWQYLPTQAETNYDAFCIEFYHVDAVSGGPVVNVVTGVDISTVKTKTDFLPSATAGASGGVLICGTNTGATVFTNSGGAGLTIQSTGGNGHGLAIFANGTGHGLRTQGGATNGSGSYLEGQGSGHGFWALGGTSGSGFAGNGYGTGHGAVFTGGTSSGANGVVMVAGAGSGGQGLRCNGEGSGNGIYAYGGTSGAGLYAVGQGAGHGFRGDGGATSGAGMYLQGAGTGHGLRAQGGSGTDACGVYFATQAGAGSGYGMYCYAAGAGTNSGIKGYTASTGYGAQFHSNTNAGLYCNSSGGNGNGLMLLGNGTGSGIECTSGTGAAATGLKIVSQAASGLGHGMSVTGVQTGNALRLIASGATALHVESTGGGGHGAYVQGNGAGYGMRIRSGNGSDTYGVSIESLGIAGSSHGVNVLGGSGGHGIKVVSGSGSNTNAMHLQSGASAGDGVGLRLQGAGDSGYGLMATGSRCGAQFYANDSGVEFIGDNQGVLISGSGGAYSNAIFMYNANAGPLVRMWGAADGSPCVYAYSQNNGDVVRLAANGSGSGLLLEGGATGHGLKATGGATSGSGLYALGGGSGPGIRSEGGATAGHGLSCLGGSGGSGLRSEGGGTGYGALLLSGTGATGDGFRSASQSTNGYGMVTLGNGTGFGILARGGTGASAHGISAESQAASGSGYGLRAYAAGAGTNSGLLVQSASSNANGALITASGGTALRVESTGNGGHGIAGYGNGSGSGILGQGGATSGPGALFSGQGTGHGLHARSGTGSSATGALIESQGVAGTSHGLNVIAGSGGHGLRIRSGAGTTNAIDAESLGTVGGNGLQVRGSDNGQSYGIYAQGPYAGAQFYAPAGSGVQCFGNNIGLELVGYNPSGANALFMYVPDAGAVVRMWGANDGSPCVYANTYSNGHAVHLRGSGSGSALNLEGGATGDDLLAQFSTDQLTQIEDTVWDAVLAAHQDAGSTGEALYNAGASGATPAQIWAYGSRTLTQSWADVSQVMLGITDITRYRATTWTITFAGLGSLVTRTKLWFTIRANRKALDPTSLVQIEETAGLTVLNGHTSPNVAWGDITVTDPGVGDITVRLEAEAAAMLLSGEAFFDLKVDTPTGTYLLTNPDGRFVVRDCVTNAIS